MNLQIKKLLVFLILMPNELMNFMDYKKMIGEKLMIKKLIKVNDGINKNEI